MTIFVRTTYNCDVCNHDFYPVLLDIIEGHRKPKVCPNCKSTEWNRDNKTYSIE